jgi:NADPH:quinone reductase-like Zn-dependent oxidoreductase
MRAITYSRYGSPDLLRVTDIPKPTPARGQVLIRVRAAAVNPYDWHFMRGIPYFMRLMTGLRAPRRNTLGADLAGVVESVGSGVSDFQPGDEVLGLQDGAFAEYVAADAKKLGRKPDGISFEQAAAIPIAGLTALQGVRDAGLVRLGQRVLIVGASGGVGSFAVPLAKQIGAHVTGVCSTGNADFVRSLGADEVIDYTREDWTAAASPFDVVFHLSGTQSVNQCRRPLSPKGRLVLSTGDSKGRWLGPLGNLLKGMILSPFVSQTITPLNVQVNRTDLETVAGQVAEGTLQVTVAGTHPLEDVPSAIAQVETTHTRGKLVIVL